MILFFYNFSRAAHKIAPRSPFHYFLLFTGNSRNLLHPVISLRERKMNCKQTGQHMSSRILGIGGIQHALSFGTSEIIKSCQVWAQSLDFVLILTVFGEQPPCLDQSFKFCASQVNSEAWLWNYNVFWTICNSFNLLDLPWSGKKLRF